MRSRWTSVTTTFPQVLPSTHNMSVWAPMMHLGAVLTDVLVCWPACLCLPYCELLTCQDSSIHLHGQLHQPWGGEKEGAVAE